MHTDNFVRAFWYMSNNFGDNLNYDVIKYISGREPVCTFNRQEEHYIVCGSILTEAKDNTTVWGAGFGNSYDSIKSDAKVITVRGHLSEMLIDSAIEYVGDPALIMPMIYNPTIKKKYNIGIIPHWSQIELISEKFMYSDELLFINPLQPVKEVIDKINSCENIASSSLHGLILADAYNVPNQWIDFGTEIGGDGFKFKDYYSTTDLEKQPSKVIIPDLFVVSNYAYDLNELINTCPFKK